MFVRRKKNKSGSVSVQVIRKQRGVYEVAHTVGSARNEAEIVRLEHHAQVLLALPAEGQHALFEAPFPVDQAVEQFLADLANAHIRRIGPELIFGALFDEIGFSAVTPPLFRHLTIARLAYPASKLKTVDYLARHHGIQTTEDAIYKFLDRFEKRWKTVAEQVAYNHSKKILGTISVVFYDMTTLYFEAEDEDDLRKIGFSKDGKFQCPQIMIGLLVGEGGYPIGYDIFEGNTFEGHTLIPAIEKIQKKYGFDKPIVVADAGLLSKENIEKLIAQKYEFILGARIKNETNEVKAKILEHSKTLKDGDSICIKKTDGTRLIVTFSDKRARKDAHNRLRGLERLKKKVRSGKLTKQHINNRGYNKFLVIEGEAEVKIDETKTQDDAAWDGLKGYMTNTTLEPKKVVEHYGHLWQIEYAFRISKTDLRIRPVFHYRRRRIEAHLCIVFVAYTIWKELERRLKEAGVTMSARRAGELTHTMYAIDYTLPESQQSKRKILRMDDEQRVLYDVIRKL